MNALDIYNQAEEITDPAARRRYLDEACRGDVALRARVEEMLGLSTIPAEVLPDLSQVLADPRGPSDAAPDPWIGYTVGGVRLERVVGHGGMGRVYSGVESSTGGIVALKMLLHAIASDDSMRRFEQEARLLARLRHPGIAQVHSAGTIESHGLTIPYFIMEYIPDAAAITDYAAAQNLNTAQRLDLFRRVCEAVAHGHEHGVIHRDLKPANILVDAHGQPKVIDFGVAKCTDVDPSKATLTAEGAIAGTPAYMSPEQVDGDPDAITVRCDVHALGVVLYELLAGRMPFDFRNALPMGIAQIIRTQEPTPLSSVSRAYRGDLDAIVSKCLEKDRNHRFAGAADLGAEIGRYLAGEAILTRPPGFFGGVLRLARRHKAAAAATLGVAASLVAAVVGISVFAYRAEAHRKVADEQRDIAEAARNVARRSRDAAESLVGFMTTDLRDKLEPIGRLDLMEDVLTRLRDYHTERRRLEDAGQEDVTTDELRTRATSFDSSGDLETALGHLEAARQSHEEGLEIRERAARRDPGNADARFDLTYSLNRLADVAIAMGNRPRARECLERFRGIVDSCLADDPERIPWRYASSVCEIRLGVLAQSEGDLSSARTHFERGLADLEALLPTDPGNRKWRHGLAADHGKLGDLAVAEGNLAAAKEHHAAALTILEALLAEDPLDANRQRDASVFHDRLGEIATALGHDAAASEHFNQGLAVRQRLVELDPRNAAWQRALSASHARLGDLALAKGDVAEARLHIGRLLSIRNTLAADDPGNAARLLDLAVAHDRAGALALSVDDAHAARGHFDQAFSIAEDLVTRDPASSEWARALASFANRRGSLALDQQDLAAAAVCFARALAVIDERLAREPGSPAWQWEAATTHNRLQALSVARGDPGGAEDHAERALRLMEGLVARDPQDARWQRELAITTERWGTMAMTREAWPEARERFVAALGVLDDAFPDPRSAAVRGVLSNVLGALAECHRRLGDAAAAEACEERLAEIGTGE